MEEQADTAGEGFIYTNWRGKSFIIDERFAKEFRASMMEDGTNAEEVAYLTPEYLMENMPFYESEERWRQLEEMWEMPEAKTNR